MADSVRVNIVGLKQLHDTLEGLNRELRTKMLRRATVRGSRVVVNAARTFYDTPEKTGALKKSIKSLKDKRESRKDFEVRAVSVFKVKGTYGNTPANRAKGKVGKKYLQESPTFYWKFHELGTVKHRARHYIEFALAHNVFAVSDEIKRSLEKDFTDYLSKKTQQQLKGVV